MTWDLSGFVRHAPLIDRGAMSVTVLLSDFSNQPFLGSACENRQFYRRQQPLSYERSPEGDHDTKGQGKQGIC
jgi:hypothetical protein